MTVSKSRFFKHSRFALKSPNTFGIVTERFREKLDGKTAVQCRIGGLVDVSNVARTDVTRDFVVCECGSDHAVNENCCGSYQKIRMSFTDLTLTMRSDEKESQCLVNR